MDGLPALYSPGMQFDLFIADIQFCYLAFKMVKNAQPLMFSFTHFQVLISLSRVSGLTSRIKAETFCV